MEDILSVENIKKYTNYVLAGNHLSCSENPGGGWGVYVTPPVEVGPASDDLPDPIDSFKHLGKSTAQCFVSYILKLADYEKHQKNRPASVDNT